MTLNLNTITNNLKHHIFRPFVKNENDRLIFMTCLELAELNEFDLTTWISDEVWNQP